MDPIVIIGGGIAGATCAKVFSLDNPAFDVILISASPVVKMVANLRTIGRSIDIFDVIEQNSSALENINLKVLHNNVILLDSKKRTVTLDNGSVIKYSKLAICTGAKPKMIPMQNDINVKRFIKCIRDTETAKDFQSILSTSKRIIIVGNGGIATELVYEVSGCEIVWAIKDNNFGATFFDSVVSKFFSDFLKEDPASKGAQITKRHHFTVNQAESEQKNEFGVALGPDWHNGFSMIGKSQKNVVIEKCCQISNIYRDVASIPTEKSSHIVKSTDQDNWNVYVELSTGQIYGCDMVISATGVLPNSQVFTENNTFTLGADKALLVDNEMRTSIEHIYAAGDVCAAGWPLAAHWFQMRLWTQARQMGFYAAKCISAHIHKTSPELYFNFDVFTHVTRFFGLRVILLGLYNGQGLPLEDCSIQCRVTAKKELIKVVLRNGSMQGAVLIGETDFEETFEKLIYNQFDLSRFGEHLLDDVVDVEDFFD